MVLFSHTFKSREAQSHAAMTRDRNRRIEASQLFQRIKMGEEFSLDSVRLLRLGEGLDIAKYARGEIRASAMSPHSRTLLGLTSL